MSVEGTTRRIGTAMAWSVLARGVRFVLGLATSVVVVRGLGEHDYGVLSVVRSVLMFVAVLAGVGSGQALLKFLPALRVGRSTEAARRLIRRAAWMHAAGWSVLLALSLALRGWTERVFHSDGVGILIVAGIALALFEVFFTFATSILNASYDARRLSAASIASHVVYLGALAVVLPAGWGVVGVLAAAAAGNAVACAMVAPRLRHASAFGDDAPREDISAGRVLRYAIPFALTGLLNIVVWRQSETLLLGHFRTPEETGFFDLAYRLPQTMLEFVPGTVWPLVMAGMSEAFARDPSSIRRVVDRYYRMLFVLCAPICLGGAVLAGRAVGVLFGEPMMPAAVPMQLFFLILTVSFFSTPLSMTLYVLEKTHLNLLIYCLLAVINVGLDLALIPKYGVPGAVVPVAIAIALQPLIYFVAVRRLVPGIGMPLAYIGRCFLGAASVGIAVPLLLWIDGAAGLVIAAAAAVVATAVAYRGLGVMGRDELEAIASIPAPFAGRVARFLDRTR